VARRGNTLYPKRSAKLHNQGMRREHVLQSLHPHNTKMGNGVYMLKPPAFLVHVERGGPERVGEQCGLTEKDGLTNPKRHRIFGSSKAG